MAGINSQEVFEALNLSTSKGKNFKRVDPCSDNGAFLKLYRIKDEQDAVNRYKWPLLPSCLNGNTIERMIWYKGQVALFYFKALNRFFVLPFIGKGCDYLGRPTKVTPIQWGSTESVNGQVKEFIKGLEFTPVYDLEDAFAKDGNYKINPEECCIILQDYTPQLSFNNIPRAQLNDVILQHMSEIIPIARTSLINNCGVKGVRVNNEDEFSEVQEFNQSLKNAVLTGQGMIPIIGSMDFQELTGGNAVNSEEYLLYLQALDNLRLSFYGLKTGGLFQKKSHMLEGEYEMNANNNSLTYMDGLSLRQDFCTLANIVFAPFLNEVFWCEPSEVASNADLNGDGVILDKKQEITNNNVEVGGGEEDDG